MSIYKEIKDVAIFRAGDYGEKGSYTEDELTRMAKAYNEGRHVAPVTTDHKQDWPKWGEIKPGSAKVKDGVVFADLDLHPDFLPAVKNKLYDKRSIELYTGKDPEGNDTDHPHIAAVTFLGAQRPEVKGLPEIQFSENDSVTIEFSEHTITEPAMDQLEELKAKVAELEGLLASKDSEIEEMKEKMGEYEKKEMEEETVVEEEMGEKEKALMSELAAANERLKALEAKNAVDEIDRKFSELKDNGVKESVLDAAKPIVFAALDMDQTIKFGEKDNVSIKDAVFGLLEKCEHKELKTVQTPVKHFSDGEGTVVNTNETAEIRAFAEKHNISDPIEADKRYHAQKGAQK